MAKNNFTGLIVAGAIALILGVTAIGSYNGLTNSQIAVEKAESKIDTTLQRRYDLIPNVVNTVKGYMTHEKEIFTQIADARSKIGSAKTEESKRDAESQLDSAVSRLLVLTENYPQLKADSQTSALIAELEGTENRIFVARNDYNEVAANYNAKVRRFPGNIWAGIFGFERVDLYEADDAADKAPTVDLNN